MKRPRQGPAHPPWPDATHMERHVSEAAPHQARTPGRGRQGAPSPAVRRGDGPALPETAEVFRAPAQSIGVPAQCLPKNLTQEYCEYSLVHLPAGGRLWRTRVFAQDHANRAPGRGNHGLVDTPPARTARRPAPRAGPAAFDREIGAVHNDRRRATVAAGSEEATIFEPFEVRR